MKQHSIYRQQKFHDDDDDDEMMWIRRQEILEKWICAIIPHTEKNYEQSEWHEEHSMHGIYISIFLLTSVLSLSGWWSALLLFYFAAGKNVLFINIPLDIHSYVSCIIDI